MEFDYTTLPERAGYDAIAVDALGKPGAPGAPKEGFDAIPMWVADMNFLAPSCITDAMAERLKHPTFGYFEPRDEYFDAIIRWQKDRNGVQGLTKEDIGYENGVLGGVVSALEAFSSPGDAILVHNPTYIGFTGSIEHAGRRIVHSALKRDADGVWRMDLEDMAQKIEENKIHLVVFCNPHNPCGRVWTREELEAANAVYAAHDCVVISDEIWSDLILPGHKHIPYQSINDDAKMRTIAFYAPSKTFSLAGLVGSYHIVYSRYLRDRLVAASTRTHYNAMNVLSMYAAIGAFSKEGETWLDGLLPVLDTNVDVAVKHLSAHKGVDFFRPEGTYMLFLDCAGWCQEHKVSIDELQRAGWDVGVAWQDGRPFQAGDTIRMNLALPTARIEEAFDRLDRYVFTD